LLCNQIQVRINSALSSAPFSIKLPAPASAKSISGSAVILIDTTPPAVLQVTTTAPNGTYALNSIIDITVTFTAPVTFYPVTDALTSQLLLDVNGAVGAPAMYYSGAGTNTLVYRYTILAGHSCSALDYTSTAALTGQLKRDSTAPTTLAILTLPLRGTQGSLGYSSNIIIKPSGITVVIVTTTHPDGTIGVAEAVLIRILFTAPVTVDTAQVRT
jgi:large repetitive protein